MPMSRDTGRIVTLSLLSVFLWVMISDNRFTSDSLAGAISYNCYSCDEAKTECKLVLLKGSETAANVCAGTLDENGVPYSDSCAAACKCPSGTWPCDVNACLAAFQDVKNWQSYKPSPKKPGYRKAVLRGRYLYFVPYKTDDGPHGLVWRYDTLAALDSQTSWLTVDLSKSGFGTAATGFIGGDKDDRYVYFAPNETINGPSGAVMRYDTTKDMTQFASWEMTDPSESGGSGLNAAILDTAPKDFSGAKGFNGAVFDGNYVYFVPDTNASGGHGNVLRYNVSEQFDLISSWEVMNPFPANAGQKGYAEAKYDGRYIYFIPKGNEKSGAMHGEVLRYDTRAPFTAATSWTTFDPSSNGIDSGARGYNGGVIAGKYLYLSPFANANGPHGNMLRYDLTLPFGSISSWTVFDVSENVDPEAKKFIGAEFDGQFVYFPPYYSGEENDGKILRYNTKESFTDKNSWTVMDAGETEAATLGLAAASAGSSSSVRPGAWLEATGVHGEKSADGVLTIPSNGRVTFDWECPGSNFTNPDLGMDATPVVCTFGNEDTKIANVAQYGVGSSLEAAVSGNSTYSIECSFERYNDDVRVKVDICSEKIAVRIGEGSAPAPSDAGLFRKQVEAGDTVTIDGSAISVKRGSQISFRGECLTTPKSDPANGIVASGLVCGFKANGAAAGTGDVQYQGPQTFSASPNAGTYSFGCWYTLTNSLGGVEKRNTCEQSVNVAVTD